MRLFTGIALPQEATEAVQQLIQQMKPLARLSWTKPEKLHVTTKFIGEWPEDRLPELQKALSAVSIDKPIEIHIRRIGYLPNPRFPLSVFAGVQHTEELTGLASSTEAALEPLGIAREQRVYRPHVTLGRIKKREPIADLRKFVVASEFEVVPFIAPSFHLYLSSNGTYTKLSEYPLNIS